MGAFVTVRGVDTGSQQSYPYISTGSPIRLAVRSVECVYVDFVGNLGRSGEFFELACELMVIGSTFILRTDCYVELIRCLTLAYGSHIDGDKLEKVIG